MFWLLVGLTNVYVGFILGDPTFNLFTIFFGGSGLAALGGAAFFLFRKVAIPAASHSGYRQDEKFTVRSEGGPEIERAERLSRSLKHWLIPLVWVLALMGVDLFFIR